MAIRHLVILAAGRGERMKLLTQVMPKAMVPVQEKPLISHNICKYKEEIVNLHVTVGYKAEMLSQYLLSNHPVKTIINTSGQGNSWWIFNTLLSLIDEPVLVMTCDNIADIDIRALEESYSKFGDPLCMLIPTRPIKGISGDFIFSANGLVTSLSREHSSEHYCSGIQVLNPYRICTLLKKEAKVDDFSLLWARLINSNQLFVAPDTPSYWRSFDTVDHISDVSG